MARSALDRTLVLGTDVAGFFLFHPDDLAHRAEAPLGWYGYDFACRKEFEAGRLVGFGTGSDGGFRFRVTTGALHEREERARVGSWDFRLRVRRRVLLDNGDCLPNEDFCDEADEADERWIKLPNGDYRVTVHVLAWGQEQAQEQPDPNAAAEDLPHYVIRFEPVEDISAIPILSTTPPDLLCDPDSPPAPGRSSSVHETYEEEKGPLPADTFMLLETDRWQIVPGFGESLPMPDAVYEAAHGSVGSRMLPNRIREFVLAPPGAGPGQVAVLSRTGGASRSGNGPWRMGFRCRRLVRVVKRLKGKGGQKVRVEPLDRPPSAVPPADPEALKSAFAAFAAKDPTYREEVDSPDFEAERVAALPSVEGLTNCLIHHIPMPQERRLELLLLPDAERVRQLCTILTEATSTRKRKPRRKG
jgi:hypothetical protein